jgi:hypothetical protein
MVYLNSLGDPGDSPPGNPPKENIEIYSRVPQIPNSYKLGIFNIGFLPQNLTHELRFNDKVILKLLLISKEKFVFIGT